MTLSFKRLSIWLTFFLCFWGIPAGLVSYGYFYIQEQKKQLALNDLQAEINRFYGDIEPFINAEAFWSSFFFQQFESADLNWDSPEESFTKALNEIRRKIKCEYVIFSDTRGVATSSVALEPVKEWKNALSFISKVLRNRDFEVTKSEEISAGKVLGPQLYWGHLGKGKAKDGVAMVWADSTFKKPLIWAHRIKHHVVLLLINHEDVESSAGISALLEDFCEKTADRFRFAIIENSRDFSFVRASADESEKLKNAYKQYLKDKSAIVRNQELIVFPVFIKPGLEILGYVSENELEKNNNLFVSLVLLLLLSAYGILLGRYSYQVIVVGTQDSLSLRWKLRFLFFFANGLPLMVLFFIGTDYLNQKRDSLLQETLGKGIAYLQDFDEKIEVEFARTLINKKRAEQRLLQRLSTEPMTNDSILEFASGLGSETWKVALIASKSHVIGTEDGIIDEKKGIYPKKIDGKTDSSKEQLAFTRKIGQFFLAKLNGEKISEKIATEIELLFESVTQKPLNHFIYELLARRGNIMQWGFGQNVHPAIIDTFYLEGSESADFFFLCNFKRTLFQHSFLKKRLPSAGRNNLQMQLIALVDGRFSVPPDAYKNSILREFGSSLTSYPSRELIILRIDDRDYIAFGFIGKYINDYQLIGLCPVDMIDSAISKQRQQLFIFAALSLLLTFILAQLLAQGFLIPLQVITAGAHAIEAKNFEHRLPDLGRDEFGAMGKIFNSVMVDLEELSVASAIQEQLLPQAPIQTGKFSLYGKSLAMGELGGDYYDFVELEQQKFGALLGDVAGHGVGAALIMAIAKAGIIQSDHLLDQPQQLLSRLHSLILASKTKKQRKVMTFQYIFADGLTGKCRYSNAGGCFPFIVRDNGSRAEEMSLAGAALGAFKKPNYTETEISFSHGDAIIFYTDGIVEARNSAGEELGYDNLKKMLMKCWDMDAEVYYQNIIADYLNHIGDEGAQDDLTMVIMVYNDTQSFDTEEIERAPI